MTIDRDHNDLQDEGPQEIDLQELGGDDSVDVTICPACGAEVYEDAERCGACGQYLVRSQVARSAVPWWWIVLAIAAAATIWWTRSC